jgi:hypothetical protein
MVVTRGMTRNMAAATHIAAVAGSSPAGSGGVSSISMMLRV